MDFYTNIVTIGNNVYVRGYRNDERFEEVIKYQPTFYISSKKQTAYTDIYGQYLTPKKFSNIWEARKFIDSFSDIANYNYCGQENFSTCVAYEKYGNEDLQYDISKIKICYIDIENAIDNLGIDPVAARTEVLVITMLIDNKIITLGCRDFTIPEHLKGMHYIKCRDERDLLKKFLNLWKKFDIDIVTGFNTSGYDLIYLYNRIAKLFDEDTANSLSPYGICRWVKPIYEPNRSKISRMDLKIYGIESIDYFDLYRKYGKTETLESYSLNNVASHELNQKKIDYSEYGNLNELYKENYQKYVEYNIQDVLLVKRIEDKLKLLQLVITLSYFAHVNFEDVFSQTRIWDSLIYFHLMKQNIIVPGKKKNVKNSQYGGAYVKDPEIGLHEWIMYYDVEALYPTMIINLNIGPETLVKDKNVEISIEELLERKKTNQYPEYSMAANGCLFKKDKQSFLSFLSEKLGIDRKKYKKLMLDEKRLYEETKDIKHKALAEQYDVRQRVYKECRNSEYGFVGCQFSRFYDIRLAEAITYTAQLVNRLVEKNITNCLNNKLDTDYNWVKYMDTDSCVLSVSNVVKKYCQGFSKSQIIDFIDGLDKNEISKVLKDTFSSINKQLSFYKNILYMKREIIAEKGIWTAKKRYALTVWDQDGLRYKYPHLKITGLEAIRSTTPTICRKRIKTAIKLLLLKDERKFRKYVELFEKRFYKLTFEEIAEPRGVNNIEKYIAKGKNGNSWKKGSPVHVKASIVYNNLLKKHNLTGLYDEIYSSDKIKWCYLKAPNIIGAEAIAIKSDLPKEFGLEKYVDYERMFDKTFISPLRTLINAAGWHFKEPNTVLDLFTV